MDDGTREVWQTFVRRGSEGRRKGAHKRTLKREGYAGFERPAKACSAAFITSNARLSSKNCTSARCWGGAEHRCAGTATEAVTW